MVNKNREAKMDGGGKMVKLHLTGEDWAKLSAYAGRIARRLDARLPEDWALGLDEVQGAVFDAFVYLLGKYRPGAASPATWCWTYGEKLAWRRLMDEYRLLKRLDPFCDDFRDDDEDDGPSGVVPPERPDAAKRREDVLRVHEAMDKMSDGDKAIADRIMQGYSYAEIAQELGTNKMDITRRMRKYGEED